MATVTDIAALVEAIAPKDSTFGYDNVGLLIGRGGAEVNRVLIALDATLDVIEEAAALGAELIISHHPAIFSPLTAVTDGTAVGKRVIAAIERGVAVYSAHTNLDFAERGINFALAEKLMLRDIKPLEEGTRYGRIGNFPVPVPIVEVARTLSARLGDGSVRLAGPPNAEVKRVAVVNGSGGDEKTLHLAIAAGADALITGEIKHHVAAEAAERGFPLVEASHYATERFFMAELCKMLGAAAKRAGYGVEFAVSGRERNPFKSAMSFGEIRPGGVNTEKQN